MTAHEADSILLPIRSSAHKDAVRVLLCCGVRYVRMRTDWRLLSQAERLEQDSSRTAAHNAFIEACHILGRAMAASGESPEWRRARGRDRRVIGDFACHVHCLLGLEAR